MRLGPPSSGGLDLWRVSPARLELSIDVISCLFVRSHDGWVSFINRLDIIALSPKDHHLLASRILRHPSRMVYNADIHPVGLVLVVSGIGLRKTDFFSTPDPFVQVTLGQESYYSKPAKKTLSPVWNQTFFLSVTVVLELERLVYREVC